ncbi:MAG: hypothetical protein JST15_09830 [Bacteroidetes bacterium]|nr:hypothetical protein [Bacteroidota bacterium]
MSVRKLQTEFNTFYYFTFTCFRWIPFFEITDFYNYIYRSFDILKAKNIFTCGYVIMPNHLHSLVFTKNETKEINFHIGETKRFMSYEIVSRLKKRKRADLLKIMEDTVKPNESKKKKIHNVFQPSSDIKEIFTEKFIRQKLNYMHKNPLSGKWKLVEDYIDYIHSSARFYELGEGGLYKVIHYSEAMNIPAQCFSAESSA